MTQEFRDLSEEDQILELTELASQFLPDYGVTARSLEMINHGYNSTFAVVTEDEEKLALRINVNSPRSEANLIAEVSWMLSLVNDGSVSVPRPIATNGGEYICARFSEIMGRVTSAVLFSWLPGTEVVRVDDQMEPLLATGRLLADLHRLGREFIMPKNAKLNRLDDALWGFDNHLVGPDSRLDVADGSRFEMALASITEVVERLYHGTTPQIIHADVHGGNLMWHEGKLSVFDFDDCGIGLPIQDIGVTLFYLRDIQQRAWILEGYQQVAELPAHCDGDLEILMLQRRIHLLNYVLGTQNPAHRELRDRCLADARRDTLALLGP